MRTIPTDKVVDKVCEWIADKIKTEGVYAWGHWWYVETLDGFSERIGYSVPYLRTILRKAKEDDLIEVKEIPRLSKKFVRTKNAKDKEDTYEDWFGVKPYR